MSAVHVGELLGDLQDVLSLIDMMWLHSAEPWALYTPMPPYQISRNVLCHAFVLSKCQVTFPWLVDYSEPSAALYILHGFYLLLFPWAFVFAF